MTVVQAIDAVAASLRAAGLQDVRHEARLMLAAVLGCGQEAIVGRPERDLAPPEQERLAALVDRRVKREPLSRIFGMREFWSLPFRVTAATLDPRPDSETLVEAALDLLPDRGAELAILDLGTGTGCLLLALLSELPRARGLGIDCDPDTLAVAAFNARALGLAARAAFAQGDWARGRAGAYHLIVSNPPYVATGELASLPIEVSGFDPPLALDGGDDGLDCFRALAPEAARLLTPDGHLILETGDGQSAAVDGILKNAGLLPCGWRNDLAGRPRCVVARRSQARGGHRPVQKNCWNDPRSRLGLMSIKEARSVLRRQTPVEPPQTVPIGRSAARNRMSSVTGERGKPYQPSEVTLP